MTATLSDIPAMQPFHLRSHILDKKVDTSTMLARDFLNHTKIKSAIDAAEFMLDFFGELYAARVRKNGSIVLEPDHEDAYVDRKIERKDEPNPFAGTKREDAIALMDKLVRVLSTTAHPVGKVHTSEGGKTYFQSGLLNVPVYVLHSTYDLMMVKVPAHSRFVDGKESKVKTTLGAGLYVTTPSEEHWFHMLVECQAGRLQWGVAKYLKSLVHDLLRYSQGDAAYDGFSVTDVTHLWSESLVRDFPEAPTTRHYTLR